MTAEDLGKLVAELRAGEEPIADERVELSPGQFLWRLHRMPEAERLDLLLSVLTYARKGRECGDLMHQRALDSRARLIRSLTRPPERGVPCGYRWIRNGEELACVAMRSVHEPHAGEHYAYVGSGW